MKNNRRTAAVIALMLMTAAAAFTISQVGLERKYAKELAFYDEYRVLAEIDGYVDKYFIAEYDGGSLVEGAADGMVAALGDRWSYYMTAQELEEYRLLSENRYAGIGVTVVKQADEGLLVQSVSAGSPAENVGIAAGDVLTAVGETELGPMTLDEAKRLIASLQGQEMMLTVKGPDGSLRQLELSCEVIETPPVSWELHGRVGVVSITNFEKPAAEMFTDAVNDLLADGADALLFDLRFNPGGRLSQLKVMLDKLLPEGVIFISEDKLGETSVTRSDAACVDMPMAVLVNEDTYSAAEYFAAVLQEYDRAQIVGVPTTGKGYSQVTFTLSEGALHISTAAYYTPSGRSLADTGVTPDVEVALDGEGDLLALYSGSLEPEDDEQLQAALRLLEAEIED